MGAEGPRSRIGVIGCGVIAPAYLRTLRSLGWIDIAAVADGDHAKAEHLAASFSTRAASVADLLADDTIEAVVNLTPASAHATVSAQIIKAGKAVFSEKPLATDLADGATLLASARAAGVRFGCAPDTFLGAGLQTARVAIDRGAIGEPLAANGFMLGFGPEWWHPNPEIFYGPGAGPLFDMGPYYLTALVQLLGPARTVSAAARIGIEERVIHARGRVGDRVSATVPTHVASTIEMASGAIATLVTSFDVKATRYRHLEIYGTEATMAVPDPNTFGGPVLVKGILADEWREVPLVSTNVPQQRGLGLADMLSATRNGRPHRASAVQAMHVLELMCGALTSAAEGRRVELSSTCERPPLLRTDLPANRFDPE